MSFEQGADRALDCHWTVDTSVLDRLGLTHPKRRAEAQARASIIAAAVLERQGQGRRISYSRSNDWYSSAPRYTGMAYSRDTVCSFIDGMTDAGWLYNAKAQPGAHLKKVRMQSAFWASQRLVDAVGDLPLRHVGPRVPVVMRDAAGNLVDLPDTERMRRIVKETEGHNGWLGGIHVDVSPDADPADWDRGAYHWRARKETAAGKVTWSTVTPTDPMVVRIYSRERIDCNGRLYGWWQSLPKARRQELLISGELSIEPDYAVLHPTLLYALEGIVLGHDPYEADLRRWSRSAGKLALNVSINAKSIPGAVQALLAKRNEEGSDGTPKWKHDARETRALIDALIERNRPIAHRICSDAGIKLMGIDSKMCTEVLKRCRKDDVAVLPVHDSFRCAASKEGIVTGHMTAVLEETRVKLFPTVIMVSVVNLRQMPLEPVDAFCPEGPGKASLPSGEPCLEGLVDSPPPVSENPSREAVKPAGAVSENPASLILEGPGSASLDLAGPNSGGGGSVSQTPSREALPASFSGSDVPVPVALTSPSPPVPWPFWPYSEDPRPAIPETLSVTPIRLPQPLFDEPHDLAASGLPPRPVRVAPDLRGPEYDLPYSPPAQTLKIAPPLFVDEPENVVPCSTLAYTPVTSPGSSAPRM